MEKTRKRGSTSSSSTDHRVDRVEWIAGALSAFLVLSMLAYLILLGVRGLNADPELEVIEVPGNGGQTRFAVVNRGERTASNVTVSLQLTANTGAVERRSVTIDFVPAHSQVSGAFLIQPADWAKARLIVESYLDP